MRRLAGSRDGLDRRGRLWGAPTGQGAGALKKWGPYQPQSRGLLAPYDHQTRSRSNASRCIRCGHGGGNLGGCMGEYKRARGSLHVRGAFWLRSQVPIRRPKAHSFTHNEDIHTYIHTYIHTSSKTYIIHTLLYNIITGTQTYPSFIYHGRQNGCRRRGASCSSGAGRHSPLYKVRLCHHRLSNRET
eukprot:COSAG01_NODE_551_length_15579_cov_30.915181_5_plen_187_part_00